jgi:hypothetical protein
VERAVAERVLINTTPLHTGSRILVRNAPLWATHIYIGNHVEVYGVDRQSARYGYYCDDQRVYLRRGHSSPYRRYHHRSTAPSWRHYPTRRRHIAVVCTVIPCSLRCADLDGVPVTGKPAYHPEISPARWEDEQEAERKRIQEEQMKVKAEAIIADIREEIQDISHIVPNYSLLDLTWTYSHVQAQQKKRKKSRVEIEAEAAQEMHANEIQWE